MIKNTLVFLAIMTAVTWAFTGAAEGTPEIAEKEQQGCLVCHTAVGRADLNERGKYYEEKGTLEGYEAPPEEPQPEAPRFELLGLD